MEQRLTGKETTVYWLSSPEPHDHSEFHRFAQQVNVEPNGDLPISRCGLHVLCESHRGGAHLVGVTSLLHVGQRHAVRREEELHVVGPLPELTQLRLQQCSVVAASASWRHTSGGFGKFVTMKPGHT